MGNRFLVFGAFSGFICVAFGAFAVHGLALSDLQAQWIDTAWRYQAFHTVALLALGFFVSATELAAPPCRKRAADIIGIFWAAGILLFSFTLYIMALIDKPDSLVMLVPAGGVSFLAGWLALAVVAVGNSRKRMSNSKQRDN